MFSGNTLARTVLTRDGATDVVTGYVDGVQQFRFTDTPRLAVPTTAGGWVRLFEDDFAVSGESSGGFADRGAFYNAVLTPAQLGTLGGPGVIPEPASLAILAVAGLVAVRRTRRA